MRHVRPGGHDAHPGTDARGLVALPRLYLAGAGSFATEVADWAVRAGWEIGGLVELMDQARVGSTVEGYPVMSVERPPGACAVVAAGGERRRHWEAVRRYGWEAGMVVHPTAAVAASAEIGPGCVVGPGSVIGARSVVGPHTLISRGVMVGHHCRIGAFVSLLPGANLASHVVMGDAAIACMGSVVSDHVRVGGGATVAAGAVVLNDVSEMVRVQGVPAREFRP